MWCVWPRFAPYAAIQAKTIQLCENEITLCFKWGSAWTWWKEWSVMWLKWWHCSYVTLTMCGKCNSIMLKILQRRPFLTPPNRIHSCWCIFYPTNISNPMNVNSWCETLTGFWRVLKSIEATREISQQQVNDIWFTLVRLIGPDRGRRGDNWLPRFQLESNHNVPVQSSIPSQSVAITGSVGFSLYVCRLLSSITSSIWIQIRVNY